MTEWAVREELWRNHPESYGFLRAAVTLAGLVWPLMCGREAILSLKEVRLKRPKQETDRRKWPRLPIAIPVFVRSRDEKGKELLEFATALNISAGGALVAVRRSLPLAAQVLLEIPSAPLAVTNSLPKAARNLRARTLRVVHSDGYHLIGLKFARPLVSPPAPRASRSRKVASAL